MAATEHRAARTLRQTSFRVNSGFTLIEMSVVIVVIMVLAALMWPNLVREQDARERRAFFSSLGRLAGQAREMAITEKTTIALTMDSAGGSFTITEDAEGETRERRSVAIPEGVETGSFSAEGGNASSAEWQIHFYPDGTSDGGGVELTDNGRVRALQIKPEGSISVIDGPLEEMGSQKWEAGDYEKRV